MHGKSDDQSGFDKFTFKQLFVNLIVYANPKTKKIRFPHDQKISAFNGAKQKTKRLYFDAPFCVPCVGPCI